MKSFPLRLALSTFGVALLACGANAVVLDRPPEILEHRQIGASLRLLWAPGGDDDGTLHEHVVSYTVSRNVDGAWRDVSTGDARTMTYEEDLAWLTTSQPISWWDQTPTLAYRVTARTSDQIPTLSEEVIVTPSLPAWVQEVHDGKARLAWLPSLAPSGYVHRGYVVQKKIGLYWVDLTTLQNLSYIDPQTTTGTSVYRVLTVYENGAGTVRHSRASNELRIAIQPMCDGQAANPFPLTRIAIVDHDGDGYDGDDIAHALGQCQEETYEDLRFAGNGDGVWEQGEMRLFGGCILQALPVTYENVAITLTDSAYYCTGDDVIPPFDTPWQDLAHPNHCLTLALPAGLVIEGYGQESVFRSPVWNAPYLPASILELHHQDTRVTLRNLVFDGRKHEQEWPGVRQSVQWHYFGFRVWTTHPETEIVGDGIGVDNDHYGYCWAEACTEDLAGDGDDDGRCDAGEDCIDNNPEDNNTICETDVFPNAVSCVGAPISNDNGCIHNVEFRNVGTGALMTHASGWIIEDSEFHDMGCMNRGYGFDCPYMDGAPDQAGAATPPGYKTDGYGLNLYHYTSNFKVRRNEFYRTAKYGLSIKNDARSCNGLATDHEVSFNHLHHLGFTGIFNHGTIGSRIHHNIIANTTVYGQPDEQNPAFDTFGMSLGGYCSDDNEFHDNWIADMAGTAVYWNGTPETVECDGSCPPPLTSVGNTIRDNVINGACTEKDATDPSDTHTYGMAAIHFHAGAGGLVSLTNNTLTDSECRFAISAVASVPGTEPLDVRISRGSYEIGPNIAALTLPPPTADAHPSYCGAVHAYGSDRKIVVGNDTSIVNDAAITVPKACVFDGATIVIDDDAAEADPFADALDDDPHVGNFGTIVECSQDEHADCD